MVCAETASVSRPRRPGSELTLVQSQHLRELGEIDPDHVVTPGIFVDRVLHVPYGDPAGF